MKNYKECPLAQFSAAMTAIHMADSVDELSAETLYIGYTKFADEACAPAKDFYQRSLKTHSKKMRNILRRELRRRGIEV